MQAKPYPASMIKTYVFETMRALVGGQVRFYGFGRAAPHSSRSNLHLEAPPRPRQEGLSLSSCLSDVPEVSGLLLRALAE